jgi:4-azaleucine resistance transporter AzlC
VKIAFKHHRPPRWLLSFWRVLAAAAPIMLGYIALGLPCGILSAKAGMSLLQVALLSVILYSGSGQYMIPSMLMGGAGALTTALTVSMVNLRQLLYASALLPWLRPFGRARASVAASNITDESFGVNITRFEHGRWSSWQAFGVSCCSQATWIVACVAGAAIGSVLNIDTAIAGFAMTSIFTCLFLMQKLTRPALAAAAGAVLTVVAFKLLGLSNLAVFVGALAGVACGVAASHWRGRRMPNVPNGQIGDRSFLANDKLGTGHFWHSRKNAKNDLSPICPRRRKARR